MPSDRAMIAAHASCALLAGRCAVLAPSGPGGAAGAVGRIDEAMRALDCETQRNAAMAEQSSAASVELLRNAKDLNVHVALFQCQEPATPARLRRAA